MNTPLADRIRPQSLDDIVGQKHLLGANKPLRKIIESGEIPNLIFYGPSGVGKTTLATYIAKRTNRTLKKLNGTTNIRHKRGSFGVEHFFGNERHFTVS